MTRFGHKLNYVINTFVKHTPAFCFYKKAGAGAGDKAKVSLDKGLVAPPPTK